MVVVRQPSVPVFNAQLADNEVVGPGVLGHQCRADIKLYMVALGVTFEPQFQSQREPIRHGLSTYTNKIC